MRQVLFRFQFCAAIQVKRLRPQTGQFQLAALACPFATSITAAITFTRVVIGRRICAAACPATHYGPDERAREGSVGCRNARDVAVGHLTGLASRQISGALRAD